VTFYPKGTLVSAVVVHQHPIADRAGRAFPFSRSCNISFLARVSSASASVRGDRLCSDLKCAKYFNRLTS
jgi:hypothetical protein